MIGEPKNHISYPTIILATTIIKVSKSSKALRATLTMMGKGWRIMGKVKSQRRVGQPLKKVVEKPLKKVVEKNVP